MQIEKVVLATLQVLRTFWVIMYHLPWRAYIGDLAPSRKKCKIAKLVHRFAKPTHEYFNCFVRKEKSFSHLCDYNLKLIQNKRVTQCTRISTPCQVRTAPKSVTEKTKIKWVVGNLCNFLFVVIVSMQPKSKSQQMNACCSSWLSKKKITKSFRLRWRQYPGHAWVRVWKAAASFTRQAFGSKKDVHAWKTP